MCAPEKFGVPQRFCLIGIEHANLLHLLLGELEKKSFAINTVLNSSFSKFLFKVFPKLLNALNYDTQVTVSMDLQQKE